MLKINIIAINKHSAKLKIRSIEMPNAPYLDRWQTLKKLRNNK